MSRNATVTGAEPATALLVELLAEQKQAHLELLDCLRRKRRALAGADLPAIADVVDQEQRSAQRLADLEVRGRAAAASLASALGLSGEPRPTVRTMGLSLAEPDRSRLLAVVEEVRGLAARAQRESSVLKAATDALQQHVGGLIQTMNAALSRAGLYGRRGRLSMGRQVQYSVDLRS
jgi:hypothetical protein